MPRMAQVGRGRHTRLGWTEQSHLNFTNNIHCFLSCSLNSYCDGKTPSSFWKGFYFPFFGNEYLCGSVYKNSFPFFYSKIFPLNIYK